MSRASACSPGSPIPPPRPPSPVFEFQDRSSRQCSPASSVGSHASGISHPPGARKRRRITLENVFNFNLYDCVADWDDGQKSLPPLANISSDERALPDSLSSSSEESSLFTVEHPDLDQLMPLFPMVPPPKVLDRNDEVCLFGPPIPPSSMYPGVIDRKTGSRSQAKKRKPNTDAVQGFQNRKEAILERRILHFMEQGRLIIEQRDFYQSQRDFFMDELGCYVSTRRDPVLLESPYNHKYAMEYWSDDNLIHPDNIFNIYGQSDLALITSSIPTKKPANNDAIQPLWYRRSKCSELEERVSFLMERIQAITEEVEFFRSERAYFKEKLSRHADAERCHDRSGTE